MSRARRPHEVPATIRGHVDQTTWREDRGVSPPAFVEVPRGPALSWDGRVWVAAAALLLGGCVRTVTTCIEASHSRPSADWQRNDSVGASVCVEHGPRE